MNESETSLFVFDLYLLLIVVLGFMFMPATVLDMFGLNMATTPDRRLYGCWLQSSAHVTSSLHGSSCNRCSFGQSG